MTKTIVKQIIVLGKCPGREEVFTYVSAVKRNTDLFATLVYVSSTLQTC